MNILITSGGRLGTLLFDALKDEHQVRVMRRREDPAFGASCVVADVGRYEDVARAMEGCQVVFHTAVRNNTDVELCSYEQFLEANVDGTFNVCLAAVRLGVDRVVHSSTSMVNEFSTVTQRLTPGQGRAVRFDDFSPHHSCDVYALTKVMGEVAVDYFRQKHGLSIISLRYGWLAPLPMYHKLEMIYNTLTACFHEQDALEVNLQVMNQQTVGSYLICAPSCFTDEDAQNLWLQPEIVLKKYYPAELDYLKSKGFAPQPIASWLDCSRAMEQLGYQPRYDFERFVAMHRASQF